MALELVLLLMISIGAPAFLLGCVLQLRGRPMSVFNAPPPSSSIDRLGAFLMLLGMVLAVPAIYVGRAVDENPVPLDVPVAYVIGGGAVVIAATVAALRRRSRCKHCGRKIELDETCPMCPEVDELPI